MSEKMKKYKVEEKTYEYFLDLILQGNQLVEKEHRGFVIRCLRRSKGWTQKELAEKAGISLCTMNTYESEKRTITDVMWYGFLYIFKELLKGEKDE